MVTSASRFRTPVVRVCAIATIAFGLWSTWCSTAHAYREPNDITGNGYSCWTCHDDFDPLPTIDPSAGDCTECHGADDSLGYSFAEKAGPHQGYTTTTSKCQNCHTVHKSPADAVLLLPAATIKATCETCHDGTGGWGVYGTVAARTGAASGGGHRIDVTNVVPGGDPLSGGSDDTRVFSGASGFLVCTDCHSPHGADVVAPFTGERVRVRAANRDDAPLDEPVYHLSNPTSTKLLRRSPGGSVASVAEYGSEWCLACHAGRGSDGPVHNHPVETTYVYDALPVLDAVDVLTSNTVIDGLGRTTSVAPSLHGSAVFDLGNRGYLMPYPRTTGDGGQDGHYPICQQCHEDSRYVGDLAADGSARAEPFVVEYGDGVVWDWARSEWATATADNPMFQNFPHETENRRMLVEEYDDLCLNCHPMSQLP